MNEAETKVIAWLRDQDPDWSFPFAPIMRETGLDRKTVRLACRSLKRKGLAEFNTGLWHEDGEGPAGSGYRALRAKAGG